MGKLLYLFLALASSLFSTNVYYVSGNVSIDIKGEPDSRPGTWGNAGAQYHEIKFNRPPGSRVRILLLQGDIVTFPWDQARSNGHAGVLASFTTKPNPMGAANLCTLCSADVLHYTQTISSLEGDTRQFTRVFKNGYILPEDTLVIVQAVWLNTYDVPVHIETTYNIEFDYVPIERNHRGLETQCPTN